MDINVNRRAFVSAVVSLGVLCTFNPAQAFAVSAAQKQAEVRSVKAQLDAMADEASVAGDLYHQAMDAYQEATDKVEECKTTILEMTDKISGLQTRLEMRASSMYRTGPLSYVEVLLGVRSFDDFATVWDTLNALNEEDADLVASTKVARSTLQSAQDELERQQEQAAEQLSSAESYMNQVLAKQSEYDTLYNNLSAEYRQILAEQEAAEARATAQAAREVTVEQPADLPAEQADEQPAEADSSGVQESAIPKPQESNKKSKQDTGIATDGDVSATPSSPGSTSTEAPKAPAPQARAAAPELPTHGSVVGYAYSKLGCPYVWGADGPNAFDCSGLVVWCYAKIGIRLPHYTESLYACASARFSPNDAKPGDVLYKPGHVGISTGGINCVEAMGTRWGVVESCRGGWTAALRF